MEDVIPASRIPRHRLEHFERDHLQTDASSAQLDGEGVHHFGVYSRSERRCQEQVEHSRRDFYKISLLTKGEGVFTTDGRSFEIAAPALTLINPVSVTAWQATSTPQDGYYCLFREPFLEPSLDLLHAVRRFPLFQVGAVPFIRLNDKQTSAIVGTFQRMLEEYHGHRPWRQDVLRLHLQMLMLQARRLLAEDRPEDPAQDAAHRHTRAFLGLLEKQFPIESAQEEVGLRAPSHFADALALHPNHLNAQVREATGKSMSEHIQERLLLEGRLLLTYTDWTVTEIAGCLGFSEPASFSHFFKRHTGQSPSSVRP